MADDSPPEQLVGRSADERLLEAGSETLPGFMSRPVPLPARPGRSPLVAAGVALGRLTLLGRLALALLVGVALLSGSAGIGVVGISDRSILAAPPWGRIHPRAATRAQVGPRAN